MTPDYSRYTDEELEQGMREDHERWSALTQEEWLTNPDEHWRKWTDAAACLQGRHAARSSNSTKTKAAFMESFVLTKHALLAAYWADKYAFCPRRLFPGEAPTDSKVEVEEMWYIGGVGMTLRQYEQATCKRAADRVYKALEEYRSDHD